jgi:hypothetical protein
MKDAEILVVEITEKAMGVELLQHIQAIPLAPAQ